MSQIPEHLDEVGKGWHPILLELHEKLLVLCPEYAVGQVKEKYAALCVYLDNFDSDGEPYSYPEQVWEEVNGAERASMKICEVCGRPGEISTRHWWVKTVCREHDV